MVPFLSCRRVCGFFFLLLLLLLFTVPGGTDSLHHQPKTLLNMCQLYPYWIYTPRPLQKGIPLHFIMGLVFIFETKNYIIHGECWTAPVNSLDWWIKHDCNLIPRLWLWTLMTECFFFLFAWLSIQPKNDPTVFVGEQNHFVQARSPSSERRGQWLQLQTCVTDTWSDNLTLACLNKALSCLCWSHPKRLTS